MSTAVSHPNIALIKYWGKYDEELILPATSSIAMTLDVFPTKTTVRLQPNQESDSGTLNGSPISGDELARLIPVLDRVRKLANTSVRAHVSSNNSVPTAAGLASSSAGFSALAAAAAHAYGLDLTPEEASRLARRGSGSASRSIFPGLSRWNAGDSDESSYAEALDWVGPELGMLLAIVSADRKPISSREAMRRTMQTSPFYQGWVESNQEIFNNALQAISDGDLEQLGQLTELSTWRMHASMLGSNPPIRYLNAESIRLFDSVASLRREGLLAYATADAGPNVKVLCRLADRNVIFESLRSLHPAVSFVSAASGPGTQITEDASL